MKFLNVPKNRQIGLAQGVLVPQDLPTFWHFNLSDLRRLRTKVDRQRYVKWSTLAGTEAVHDEAQPVLFI